MRLVLVRLEQAHAGLHALDLLRHLGEPRGRPPLPIVDASDDIGESLLDRALLLEALLGFLLEKLGQRLVELGAVDGGAHEQKAPDRFEVWCVLKVERYSMHRHTSW